MDMKHIKVLFLSVVCLVAATLTIEFKAGNGLALVTTQEDKESLTDQLAARKAAVEGMGE